jgi:hypothetical protein
MYFKTGQRNEDGATMSYRTKEKQDINMIMMNQENVILQTNETQRDYILPARNKTKLKIIFYRRTRDKTYYCYCAGTKKTRYYIQTAGTRDKRHYERKLYKTRAYRSCVKTENKSITENAKIEQER